MDVKMANIADQIKDLDAKKEKLDKLYSRLLWKKVYRYTRKEEDLPKAAAILNQYPLTVGATQLFQKLRTLKIKLQPSLKPRNK